VAVESCIVFCCVEGGMDRTGSSNCGDGELQCVLLCCGWDRTFGKQQLLRWRVALCSAVLRVGSTGREAATVAVESYIEFCWVVDGIDRTGSSNCGGGELHCVLLGCGWDRPDGKQQLWRWRVALCSAVLRVGSTGREAATVAVESCIVFCWVVGGIDRTGNSNCGGGELLCVLLC